MIARASYPLLGLLIIAAIWEGSIRFFDIPPFVLPPLGQIAERIWTGRSEMIAGLSATLYEAGTGYVIGVAIGLLLAIAVSLSSLAERSVMPLFIAINSVPIVAYVPVSFVAFGLGAASKIAMVALTVGFTVFLSAVQGLKSVDPSAVNLLRSFGAGQMRIIWMFSLPAAMPIIVSGLRVSIVRAMIVAIVAEMLGAYDGLGRIIYEATQQVDFLRTWAAIAVASLASLVIYGVFVWCDRRLVWWK
ncbi:MAG: ABC transporter permease [Rhizobiaceae bacterium]|nr:ABC transporter permease [Rhizobiaceae bacterium]